jgi:hypothetical protein
MTYCKPYFLIISTHDVIWSTLYNKKNLSTSSIYCISVLQYVFLYSGNGNLLWSQFPPIKTGNWTDYFFEPSLSTITRLSKYNLSIYHILSAKLASQQVTISGVKKTHTVCFFKKYSKY